ncbi:MAG TPA: non-ribosomal peptide synthetase, partial [Pseudonocardiaceae bacterium]
EITGSIEYATTLFRRDQAQRFARGLSDLISSCVAAPLRSLRLLRSVSAVERRYQVDQLNPAAQRYPERSVSWLFDQQMRRTPDHPAVISDGGSLTYRQLDDRAAALAAALAAAGVGRHDLVVLCVQRSAETIIGALAILRLGVAYVAVEPDTPAARRRQILDEVRPAAVLTSERLAANFSGHAVVLIERADSAVGVVPAHDDIDDLAYVAFTSGSTGEPKGVCVPHRGIVRLVDGADYARLGPGTRMLHFAPIAFDASTLEIWGPLLTGGTVVVCPPGLPSPAELGRILRDNAVTIAWLTSAWFQLMVDDAIEGFETVECVLTGGDVVSAWHVQRLLRHRPGICVVNGYGPTESTTFVTVHEVSDPDRVGTALPIGRPIRNTKAYLLDDDLRLLPTGAVGELCAAGDGLAAGYLGRPDLTVARFLAGAVEIDERLYRTGDFARYRADGTLQFIGRRDDQVKIRGHRVELEEVRQALYRHPDLLDAAVVVRGGNSVDRELIAAVVVRDGAHVGPAELRAFLSDRLPSAMVPGRWLRVDSIPMTGNGKADRGVLVAQLDRADAMTHVDAEDSSAGREVHEATVRTAWTDVLRHGHFSRTDNFFDIGGNSVRAATLVAKLRDRTGVELPLRVVFEAPTVAGLGRRLAELADTAGGMASDDHADT